mmetsp:Transcript_49780/g.88001  ORF Transcript_49780/g.88001 Transcript_49780/m.88001 type:complete len:276 (+) Transcript_49780:345-1172(+)
MAVQPFPTVRWLAQVFSCRESVPSATPNACPAAEPGREVPSGESRSRESSSSLKKLRIDDGATPRLEASSGESTCTTSGKRISSPLVSSPSTSEGALLLASAGVGAAPVSTASAAAPAGRRRCEGCRKGRVISSTATEPAVPGVEGTCGESAARLAGLVSSAAAEGERHEERRAVSSASALASSVLGRLEGRLASGESSAEMSTSRPLGRRRSLQSLWMSSASLAEPGVSSHPPAGPCPTAEAALVSSVTCMHSRDEALSSSAGVFARRSCSSAW